ncbi:MAG: hypothetical protein Q4Q31_05620 [Bacillota bacterium]|nr:hypothetical protein [Bacillota bacterium]
MLMEIYLSEEKTKRNNIDIDACYQKIDQFFIKKGVKIKAPGIYQGTKNDFTTFVIAQGQLPQTNWFLKIVDQWYISFFGDTPESLQFREDALANFYKVRVQTNAYLKNQNRPQL